MTEIERLTRDNAELRKCEADTQSENAQIRRNYLHEKWEKEKLESKLAAAEADTNILDYLASLRTEVCFHPNLNGKWTFIPDVQRCDEPGGIFEGETLRTAIDAAKTEAKACTCHPSEAPVPCQQKYALTDCIKAARGDKP